MSPFIFKIPYVPPWLEAQKVLASDGVASDFFGNSVSISGTTAVVAAYNNNSGGGGSSGAVYVFEFNGSVWNQVQKLIPSDGQSGGNFGWSVSIDGNIIVVGAYRDDIGGNTDAGSAYVFEKSGTWPTTETAKLLASDRNTSDLFGWSVNIDGGIIVVGAFATNPNGFGNAGTTYMYEKAGTWPATETSKVIASDGAAGDNFGYSVDVSGNVVISGAYNSDPGGNSNQGSAYFLNKQ